MQNTTRRQVLGGLAAIGAVGCGPFAVRREPPGVHELSDQIRGKRRRCLMVIPEGLVGPAPMLVALHDAGATPEAMSGAAGWQAECAKRGWIGVFPSYMRPDMREDNAYVAHLVERVAALAGGDKARVFVLGHGAGGRRAYAFATANPRLITAVGAVGAVIRFDGPDLGFQDPRETPVSVLHLHGAADTDVPIGGGPLPCGDDTVCPAASAEAGLRPWIAALGGIEAETTLTLPPGMTGQRWAASGREVVLLTDAHAGHEWSPMRATPLFGSFFAAQPPR